MLKSMTGYGRSILNHKLGQFTAEAQSHNRKHLEIVITLPPEFQKFETEIRRWISSQFTRGRLHLKISAKYPENPPTMISANVPIAKKIQTACNQIAQELEISDREGFISSFLIANPQLLINQEVSGEVDQYLDCLHEVTFSALEMLSGMRSAEGEQLQSDIHGRLDSIAIHLQEVVNLAPKQKETYRKKLETILNEFVLGTAKDEQRILQEVTLFAEKVDISEEITRLCAHVKQFLDLIEMGEYVGKKLDFLVQEMLRECNTIGAKSVDVEIIHHVVEMKTELERIREQIQNVE